jgi:hypothetical protein
MLNRLPMLEATLEATLFGRRLGRRSCWRRSMLLALKMRDCVVGWR